MNFYKSKLFHDLGSKPHIYRHRGRWCVAFPLYSPVTRVHEALKFIARNNYFPEC